MTTAIWVVTAALLVTKLLDVLSSIQMIEEISQEANPVSRQLMKWFGIKWACWLIFIFFLLLLSSMTFLSLLADPGPRWIFIIGGGITAVHQGAVSHHNWTGRRNLVTRITARPYDFLDRLFSRNSQVHD